MPNPFKKWFHQYLYFIKKDRSATLILSVLILVVIILNSFIKRIGPKSDYDYSGFFELIEEFEKNQLAENGNTKNLFVFDPNTISDLALDSLDLSTFIKQNILSYRQAGGSFSKAADLKKIYGINDSIFRRIEPFIDIPEKIDTKEKSGNKKKNELEYTGFFDPNRADINTFRKFGFTKFQAENLMKYRENGGFFQNSNDLLKIYGIDSTLLKRIDKNIFIERMDKNIPIREEIVIQVEINNADTTELMKLVGIGSIFAQRILKYRELLGGFYSKSQLMEVYNFPMETFQKIEQNIIIDTISITKIRINYAEFSDLIRHPYLDKNKVNAILKHREKNGAFSTTEQIKSISEIDDFTYNRIRPYLTCR